MVEELRQHIEDEREAFWREARETFHANSGERWQEFIASDEIQELWREYEDEAWKEEETSLEQEWLDALRGMGA